jgi:hypothetical protein
MFVRAHLLVAVTLVAILAACGLGTAPSADPDSPVTDPGASHAPGGATADGRLTIARDEVDGPALQVTDALAASGEPVRVAGSLFVDADGRVLLCGAIAESFPPQCSGDRLEVVGLDLDAVELQEANGARWADAVELTGTVE